MFTAVAIMLLVEDGLLRLDDCIRDYFPKSPLQWQAIKIRHLLNHTSGLGEDCTDVKNEFTDEEYLAQCYEGTVAFEPGSRWMYSNIGYSLLGIIITNVSCKHWSIFLEERVFLPAEMKTACMIDDFKILKHRASGYEMIDDEIKNQQWVSAFANTLGSGSLYLSLLDWMKWDLAVAKRKLLSEHSWRQIFSKTRLNCGQEYPYGFGWEIEESEAHGLAYGHLGSWQGFTSGLLRYDQLGLTFVAMANLGETDIQFILDGIVERYDTSLRIKRIEASL